MIRQNIIIILATAALLSACGDSETSSETLHEKQNGMLKIPGGATTMGSEGTFETPYGTKRFPEEAPVRKIEVTGFWMDETEVTNDQFAGFVEATGYVTYAEREAKLEDFPKEAREFLPETISGEGSGDLDLVPMDSEECFLVHGRNHTTNPTVRSIGLRLCQSYGHDR